MLIFYCSGLKFSGEGRNSFKGSPVPDEPYCKQAFHELKFHEEWGEGGAYAWAFSNDLQINFLLEFAMEICCLPQVMVLILQWAKKSPVKQENGVFCVLGKHVNFYAKKSNQVAASGSFGHDHAIKNIPFVWR